MSRPWFGVWVALSACGGSAAPPDAPAIDAATADAPPPDALLCLAPDCGEAIGTATRCGGVCVGACPSGFTRPQAATLCADWGGALPVIHDAVLNNCVASLIPGFAWIDLRQDVAASAPDAGWAWTDGSPVDFTDWNPSEPNDGDGTEMHREDFAVISAAARWHDIIPTRVEGAVCVK